MLNFKVNIVSGYFQCAEPIEPYLDNLGEILASAPGEEFVVCIDSNAHSPLWYSRDEDDKGRLMSDFIQRKNLTIQNQENRPATHKSGTNIDLTLTSRHISRFVQDWDVHPDVSLSDHRLITFNIKLDQDFVNLTLKKFSLKNVDYNILNNNLVRKLIPAHEMPSETIEDLEQVTTAVQTAMQQTCEENLKRIKIREKHVPWWCPELSRLREELGRLRRQAQRCCPCRAKLVYLGRHRRKRLEYKAMMRAQKRKSWSDFVAESSRENPYSLPYKLAADKIKNKEVLATLQVNGVFSTSVSSTAQMLLDSLVPLDSFVNDTQEQVLKRSSSIHPLSHNLEQPITIQELDFALKNTKPKRAAGPDRIPPELLINASPEVKESLTALYNLCLTQEHFPKEWKVAKVKVIRKAGVRDWTSPSSYRPISLLPVAGKVFERIIKERMTASIDANNAMSPNQYGFRKGKSTTSAIQALTSYARQNPNVYTIAIFIDIKGAFDSLWWPEVFHNLNRIGISKPIFNVLKSYLSDRILQFSYDQETISRAMTKGCPQGSVLGPLLWNITFDALLEQNFPPGVRQIAFADDVAFVVPGNTRREVELTGNQVMEILAEWANSTKMAISTSKSAIVTLKGNLAARPPVIKYNNQRIPHVQQVKYLGVTIDTCLTFLPHVKNQGTKARTLFGKISRLLKLKYGASSVNLNFLYKTIFIPIMAYASQTWFHRLTNYAILKNLKETQRQVLINTTGAYRTSPLQALCVISNNTLLHLKLSEIYELTERKMGLRPETKAEIRNRTLEKWQEEWSLADTGRKTHDLLPSIQERSNLKHLNDIDHCIIHLLTGHGPFRTYLHRFHRSDSALCDDCGEVDHHLHAVLECTSQNDFRELLQRSAWTHDQSPWNLSSMIRNPETFKVLKEVFVHICDRRQV